MGRPGRIILRDISGRKALAEARRELDVVSWYAEQRLADNASRVFSFDTLISMVMPSGGAIDRALGGVNIGMAAVRGIYKAIRGFRSGGCEC